MSDALAVVREIIEDECVRSDEDVEALRAVLTQAETAAEERAMHLRARANLVRIAGKKEKRAEAAEAERDHARGALRWMATQWAKYAYDTGTPEPEAVDAAIETALTARAALGEDA